MPNPVQRAPYNTFQETDTIVAPVQFDELANPDHFGKLSNTLVNGLSPAEIGTLVQGAAERIPVVVVKGALIPN